MPDPEIPSQPPLPIAGQPQMPDDFVLLIVPLRKFSMGQMVITSNAQAVLTPEDVNIALTRHSQGDWGDVCEEGKRTNDRRVHEQGMILSA